MNTKPKLFVMVGLPASGKSTKSKELAKEYNATIHASDEIRRELSGDVNNQDINTQVFQTLHSRIKQDLKNGKNCIFDATNISYRNRKGFLRELKNIPCEKICVFMATPIEECLKANATRDRVVPEEVIKSMYKRFDVPFFYEGWDNIEVVYSPNSEGYYGTPTEWVNSVKRYNQENTNHALTLGEHCEKAWEFIGVFSGDMNLIIASLIHDNGKPYTKTFENNKGETTPQAHYYGHERTGAYNSFFFNYAPILINNEKFAPLYIAILIRWHMQMYFLTSTTQEQKYRKLWGETLYNDLRLLHSADKIAH